MIQGLLSHIRSILWFLYGILIIGIDSIVLNKKSLKSANALLLVRLDRIGDYILFRNYIKILRNSEKYKKYSFTLCGNIAWRDLAETLDRDYIDDFIWIHRDKFLKNIAYRIKILLLISSKGFELAIHPTYSREFFYGDVVVKASNAKIRVGNTGDGTNISKWQKKLSDNYYTSLIPTKSEFLFEFNRNKEFIEGLLGHEIDITFPMIQLKSDEIKSLSHRNYAVIFPGGAADSRKWSGENYARIVNILSNKYHLDIVIAGGPGEEYISAEILSRINIQTNIIDKVGKTSLPELLVLIAGAELLVSNDTSAVHIAAGVKTKAICLSNGSFFGRFVPYPHEMDLEIHTLFPPEMKGMEEFDLSIRKYRELSPIDINTIEPETVEIIVDQLLCSGK